jgi:hypothetical protein
LSLYQPTTKLEDKVTFSQKFLAVYSGVLTFVFCMTVLTRVSRSDAKQESFDEINVHRINVRESDGTLRMVISNTDRFPGAIVKGKEYPHPRDTAGVLFYDHEGTEDGGLIFGGRKKAGDANPESYVHLSFDQYMQDQVLVLEEEQQHGQKYSRVDINDVGDWPITDAIQAEQRILSLPESQRKAAWEQFQKTHTGIVNRIRIGRLEDKSTVVEIKDSTGNTRISMKVNAEGQASLQFLDSHGNVTNSYPPERAK